MSRNILDALMQLFALITLREEGLDRGREVVAAFLRSRLNREQVAQWLEAFESYLVTYGGAVESREVAGLKRTALRSTKVLRACSDINRDLQASEKALVLIRVLEFENALQPSDGERDGLSRELTDLVADGFGIREGEKRCYEALVFETDQWPALTQRYHEAFVIGDQPQLGGVIKEGWNAPLACFRHPEAQVVFIRPMVPGAVQLNGELLDPDRTQPFTPGSTLRHPGAAPLHFVDIQRSFMEEENIPDLTLSVEEVSHWFQYPDQQALHPFSATVHSGMLVGVMGASGSGKSTLLHLIAGSESPTFGEIRLDGHPVTDNQAHGRIGLVPQEDHLLPELTVFENLYYAARLAFGHDSPDASKERVEDCLKQLGLWAARDLPVGDALNKTISGGQRKRLNIGMELIRGPQILLVDEPTSGLSSKDSESLMDLLKQMTYNGTLVIAVIHQPSGDIFRSFDALWVLDNGGYPVYTGRPLDALVHFRSIVNHFDADQVACGQCGHVNPEQIFDIIEVPVLDGRGKPTGQRRISPKEWNDFYNVLIVPGEAGSAPSESAEEPAPTNMPHTTVPRWGRQWAIQGARDIQRKWKNQQYLLINLLEAPVLALLLSFLLRSSDGEGAYAYGTATNIPHFLFIAVIVAIFMGLTVSAEELFRDRLMRKREAHLQLDWSAYLVAKCAVLFGISALQALSFAAISYAILQLPGHFLAYAFTLFTVSACANLFGLVISLLFNSVRVIYLAIPLFIIPQLMLGGAIVPFSEVHPSIAKERGVPWPAQTMISRWGFEALTTLYAADNAVSAALFEAEAELAEAEFTRDRWVPELKREAKRALQGRGDAIDRLARSWAGRRLSMDSLRFEDGLSAEEWARIDSKLSRIQAAARLQWKQSKAKKDSVLVARGWSETEASAQIQRSERNQVLQDWTTDEGVLTTGFAHTDKGLINTRDALYAAPHWPGMGTFHAARAHMGGTVPKRWANWTVLWATTAMLMAALCALPLRTRGRPRRT